MARKTSDPKLIALKDRAAKAAADCERHYRRMKAAFNRLEKSRKQLTRLERMIDKFNLERSNTNATNP